ncbi:TraR/DksA C4-type zinc finger protein [Salmonella enterica]|nr:TraR/DksA C4-type zinc finger protein [Salmonella enterica]
MSVRTDFSAFKERLTQRLAELDALEEQASRHANVELDQNKVGRLSRMDALQQQAMQDEILARAKNERLNILRALLRIERGHFGECRECEEPIEEGRLTFDPTLQTCVRCAKK